MVSEMSSKAQLIESTPLLLWLKHKTLSFTHYIDYLLRKDANEVRMAESSNNPFSDCPDWHELEKIPEAGKVLNGCLVMHQGVKVLPTAYEGYAHGKQMQRALGIHEPQEERLFRDVIQQLPTGSSMIELGAYWAYYSLWFQQVVPKATSILVEPKLTHLNYGKRHFKINGYQGNFVQAGVGKQSLNGEGLRIVTVDELLETFALPKLTILHSDIQGYELEMLEGAQHSINNQLIDFFFISTHSDQLHKDCINFLRESGYLILDQFRISESWNPDGLIVAQSPAIKKINLKPSIKIIEL